MIRRFIFAVTLAVATSFAMGDVIVLKDGTRLEGDVKKSTGGWRITTADGKTIDVAAEKVKAIEVGAAGVKGSPEQAMSNLLSLRRTVENIADLKQIIERYKRFIEQSKDTPAAVEARKDLEMWQDRFNRGLVKLGTQWVTSEERTAAANGALAVAEQARLLVMNGRLHDAEPFVQQALDADPNCVPALYLRGVILYQQTQLPAARKLFETVASLIADHPPTLNDLGVILWRQNAQMAALNYYDQAMVAAPVNKLVLDNVAEALAGLTDAQRKNAIAQRVSRRFTEQDTRLQEIMAAQGWYRWGGTWVDKATMENLRKAELEIRERITSVRGEIDASQKRIASIEAELDTIDQSLRTIEAQSVYRDADGTLVRVAYPAVYYDLKEDARRLQSDRSQEMSKIDTANQRIHQLQTQLPKPKFTGVHQLIGAEGAPVMLPPPNPAGHGMDAMPNMPAPLPPAPAELPPVSKDAPPPLELMPSTEPSTAPSTAPTSAPTTRAN